jgi:hypothetical protein
MAQKNKQKKKQKSKVRLCKAAWSVVGIPNSIGLVSGVSLILRWADWCLSPCCRFDFSGNGESAGEFRYGQYR